MKTFKLLIVLFVGVFIQAGLMGATEDDLILANKLFQEKKYSDSLDLFFKIYKTEKNNPKLLFNIGNTYMRLGHFGKAIFYYRLGENLEPRNEDLKVNLRYARELAKDKIERQDSNVFFKTIAFWYFYLNLNELFLLFVLFNCIFWVLWTIRLFRDNEGLRWAFFISVFLSLIFLASFLFKNYYYNNKSEGVVINSEISVKAGIGDENVTLFNLHEGAEVTLLEERNEWFKIEITKDKKGWTKKKNIFVF